MSMHERVCLVTPPMSEDGRELISVHGLLQWAFGTECASIDHDEVGSVGGHGLPHAGAEHRIMQQLALGTEPGVGVCVDTSFGVSYPHDDAEMVATVLRNSVDWWLAVWVADLARSCRVPQWDLGQPRLQPRSWGKCNQFGQLGKTEVYRTVEYRHRGRVRRRKDLWVPCEWVPGVNQISRARRAYLDWWGALLYVAAGLKGVHLKKFKLTNRMPPMEPWKK